jgi:hypothetical protein
MVSRFATVTLAICLCEVTAGCNRPAAPRPAARPIAAGTVERLTVGNKPVQRPGETGENTGTTSFEGSRVEVYDQFILVTLPGGSTVLALHGWYTDLAFKRDPQQ